MKIDLKNPRYALPIIILPFLLIFFYVYRSTFVKPALTVNGKDSLQTVLVPVSKQVQEESLSDKLEAYRNSFKDADGYTAVGMLGQDTSSLNANSPKTQYNLQERRMLDSIDKVLKYGSTANSPSRIPGLADRGQNKEIALAQDRELAEALQAINTRRLITSAPEQVSSAKEQDPIEIFRKQMQLVDSMGKANDPQYQQTLKESQPLNELKKPESPVLPVKKTLNASGIFNTVLPSRDENFLTAIIDQDIRGYAGSRLRIRLLEDMMAGKFLIKKGTYLYAHISGFSGQRVNLTINSILNGGNILPVKLEIYDHDGIPGLYVPASAFREFTRDLEGNASQGISLQKSAENNSQMVMSLLQRVFQSTSSAISKMVRQNRVKLKYGSIVYLIDLQQLQTKQNAL